MSYRLIPTYIEKFVLNYTWWLVLLCLAGSQLITNLTSEYGYVAAFLWKVSGIAIGAWIGNLVYIRYFCNGDPAECETNSIHRLYFILGICAIFGLR